MISLTVFAALVGFTFASQSYSNNNNNNNGQQTAGRCVADGYYYNDDTSVMFCSNGNSYRIACAAGSMNSNSARRRGVSNTSYRDLCDINLVDTGFNQRNGYSQPQETEVSYERNSGYGDDQNQNVQGHSAQNSAPHGNSNRGYGKQPSRAPTGFKTQGQKYQGQFLGSCRGDGLYYNDETSFVICSNGNPYFQSCAPGSMNSGSGLKPPGGFASDTDFCNVNLVNQGINQVVKQQTAESSYPAPRDDNNSGYGDFQ